MKNVNVTTIIHVGSLMLTLIGNKMTVCSKEITHSIVLVHISSIPVNYVVPSLQCVQFIFAMG